MFVERSGGRAKCQICGLAIARGVARTVEETRYELRNRDSYEDDDRVRRTYCHLTCAVEVKRELAYQALIARTSPSDLVESALLELTDTKLVAEVRAFRDREYPRVEKRAVALDDPRTEELLRELEAAPHDHLARGLYAVLADHLQQRGDERGELIILDLGVSDDPAAFARRRELAAALSPKLPAGAAKWGIGFLRKLELSIDTLDEIAPILAHPACRLLETLKLQAHGRPLAIPPGVLPRSLRSLT